jgi:hypothetical protein
MFGTPTHPVNHLLLHDECGIVVQIGAADAAAASWQRRTPSQLGAASRQRLNRECSTSIGSTSVKVRQAASGDVVRYATAVVDYFDAQVVRDRNGDCE